MINESDGENAPNTKYIAQGNMRTMEIMIKQLIQFEKEFKANFNISPTSLLYHKTFSTSQIILFGDLTKDWNSKCSARPARKPGAMPQ